MDLRYPVTRLFYRRLSAPMAVLLARTPVTPIQVTWVSAAFAVAGAAAFALSEYTLGAILTFIGAITDCADGDLARMTGRTSSWGAFLDSVLDRWTDAAMILGLAFSDPDDLAAIGGLALTGSLLTSYTRARAQSLGVDCPDGIGGRDARILILVVAALLGQVFAGLLVVTITSAVTAVHRLAVAGRALRRVEERAAKAGETGAGTPPGTPPR
ncbi:CDP-alcohol phosphatidyltransferase family protein [soil metagenome]